MTEPGHEPQDMGDLSDEYTLLGELGRGGSAIVYKARDRALMRDVAIKVVRPRFAATADEAIARLEREAQTVARLQHPNIVTVHAVKRLHDGGLALVMQLVPGRTLKQVIQDEGPFAPERAERVLRDIAEALAFAHRNGVVHRDVKPENVFIDSVSGRALLSDFGIAHSSEYDSRLTMTGSAIGTPAYMAPEQIDGAPANARSDVYSLGLLTWEMLTGQRPWAGEALYTVIYKQKHEELPAIDSLRPGQVPARLQYIVERMLQKRPGARWAGAEGVLLALNAWVVPSDWKQWEESHRRRREREKMAPRPVAKAADGSDEATVRFDRKASGDVGAIPDSSSPVVVRTTTPAVAELAAEEDAAPSWANEPDDAGASRSRAPRIAVAALLALATIGGLGYAMYARRLGPFAPPATVAVASADKAAVELPIVSEVTPASDSTVAGVDSAPVFPPPADSATPPPVANADQRVADSIRVDSLVRVARRAERRAMLAAARDSAVPRAPTPATPSPSVRATDDLGVIAAGGRHSCALVAARVLCWGANDRGQLGDGDVESRTAPAPIVGDLDFVQVTTGLAHSCGIARGGDAYCWGAGDRGQLGDATFTSRSAPVRVAGNQNFRVLRAGQYHTCGLTGGGDVWCWGANANGQLGDGGAQNRSSPVQVGNGLRFVSLSAGWSHTCAIAYNGAAYCWGANANGQLGNGSRTDARAPTPVSGDQRFTSIAAGATHSCAVQESGEAFCWGRNNFGQLGTGGTGDQAVPAPVFGSSRFVSVTVGGVHSCGRTRGGQVFCWGRNVYGQLGDGTNSTRDVPTRVAAGVSFTAVNASGAHTCGTAGDDALWCWGFNVEGQLGDGTRNHLSRPTRVVMSDK